MKEVFTNLLKTECTFTDYGVFYKDKKYDLFIPRDKIEKKLKYSMGGVRIITKDEKGRTMPYPYIVDKPDKERLLATIEKFNELIGQPVPPDALANITEDRDRKLADRERETALKYEFKTLLIKWGVKEHEYALVYEGETIPFVELEDIQLEEGLARNITLNRWVNLNKKKLMLPFKKEDTEKAKDAFAYIKGEIESIAERRQESIPQKLGKYQFHSESQIAYPPAKLTFHLDNTSRQMAFVWDCKDGFVKCFPYGQILNCEILNNAHTKTTTTRVGSFSNNVYAGTNFSTDKSYLDGLGIKFSFRSTTNPMTTIPIVTARMDLNSQDAQLAISFVNRVKASVNAAMAMPPVQIAANRVEKPQNEKSPIEELKQYKELLDMGVITQDEFDAKKKQLLGL